MTARREELLERAYGYALEHGLASMSLRPLAEAIGSSPRVLLFLFGSKDGLVRALLERARTDELRFLGSAPPGDLAAIAWRVWEWLAAPERRGLLTLWVEAYARSLVEPDGPWSRREFLGLGAAAAAGMITPGALRLPQAGSVAAASPFTGTNALRTAMHVHASWLIDRHQMGVLIDQSKSHCGPFIHGTFRNRGTF